VRFPDEIPVHSRVLDLCLDVNWGVSILWSFQTIYSCQWKTLDNKTFRLIRLSVGLSGKLTGAVRDVLAVFSLAYNTQVYFKTVIGPKTSTFFKTISVLMCK